MRLAPPRMSLLLTRVTLELVNVKELTPHKRRKHSIAAARSFFPLLHPNGRRRIKDTPRDPFTFQRGLYAHRKNASRGGPVCYSHL